MGDIGLVLQNNHKSQLSSLFYHAKQSIRKQSYTYTLGKDNNNILTGKLCYPGTADRKIGIDFENIFLFLIVPFQNQLHIG